jgi:hypothetical protein
VSVRNLRRLPYPARTTRPRQRVRRRVSPDGSLIACETGPTWTVSVAKAASKVFVGPVNLPDVADSVGLRCSSLARPLCACATSACVGIDAADAPSGPPTPRSCRAVPEPRTASSTSLVACKPRCPSASVALRKPLGECVENREDRTDVGHLVEAAPAVGLTAVDRNRPLRAAAIAPPSGTRRDPPAPVA